MFVASDAATSKEYTELWTRLRRGDYQAGEFKRLSKDEREVWLQATYSPILDVSGVPGKVVRIPISHACDHVSLTLVFADKVCDRCNRAEAQNRRGGTTSRLSLVCVYFQSMFNS